MKFIFLFLSVCLASSYAEVPSSKRKVFYPTVKLSSNYQVFTPTGNMTEARFWGEVMVRNISSEDQDVAVVLEDEVLEFGACLNNPSTQSFGSNWKISEPITCAGSTVYNPDPVKPVYVRITGNSFYVFNVTVGCSISLAQGLYNCRRPPWGAPQPSSSGINNVGYSMTYKFTPTILVNNDKGALIATHFTQIQALGAFVDSSFFNFSYNGGRPF